MNEAIKNFLAAIPKHRFEFFPSKNNNSVSLGKEHAHFMSKPQIYKAQINLQLNQSCFTELNKLEAE